MKYPSFRSYQFRPRGNICIWCGERLQSNQIQYSFMEKGLRVWEHKKCYKKTIEPEDLV
jgi:hypothetical protein